MTSNPKRSVENHVRQVSEMVPTDNDDLTLSNPTELLIFLNRYIADEDMPEVGRGLTAYTQQIALDAQIKAFTRMHDYYGIDNLKLWDEFENNDNPVYLGDYLNTLKAEGEK